MQHLYLCVSDWHIGKLTDTFDVSVARDRAQRLVDLWPEFDGPVHMLVLGDMVEGESCYPAQRAHVEHHAVDQVDIATELLSDHIEACRNAYDSFSVVAVPGNHGRTSRQAHSDANWDIELYRRCGIRKTPQTYASRGILATHRGPKPTNTPTMWKKHLSRAARYEVNTIVHGHYHSPQVLNHAKLAVIYNGSLCGPDDYSDRLALYDPACQVWFIREGGRVVQVGFCHL